jgi:hypothetical protein
MIAECTNFGPPLRTDTGSTTFAARHRRNHACVLVLLVLLVPVAAQAIASDRHYLDALAQKLSQQIPVSADEIVLAVQPSCRAEQVDIRAIRSNSFGTSTLILRCKDSDALPFTATVNVRVRNADASLVKAHTVRSGRKVRLQMVTQGMSINTTAITLAAADVGDTIPVRAWRTNRVFQARVIDASAVRAVLKERP